MAKWLFELGLPDKNPASDWADRKIVVSVAGVEVFNKSLGNGDGAVGVLRDDVLAGQVDDEVVATCVDVDGRGNASDTLTATGVIVDTFGPPVPAGTFAVRTYAQVEEPVPPPEPTPEPTPEPAEPGNG